MKRIISSILVAVGLIGSASAQNESASIDETLKKLHRELLEMPSTVAISTNNSLTSNNTVKCNSDSASITKTFISSALSQISIKDENATNINDFFGDKENQFSICFIPIGNLGNKPDIDSHGWMDDVQGQLGPYSNGMGKVDYFYWISKYTISEQDLDLAIASGLNNVPKGIWTGDKPAGPLSWYEAAAFVNWLNTSKGYEPAYNLKYRDGKWSMQLWDTNSTGYDPNNLYRNKNSIYVLPSENEFYKAAFGKKDGSGYNSFSTGSDKTPKAVSAGTNSDTMVCNQKDQENPASVYEAGGLSSYGTMGQIGNISQWEENSHWGNNTDPTAPRMMKGLDWHMDQGWLLMCPRGINYDPDFKNSPVGIRVIKLQKRAPPKKTNINNEDILEKKLDPGISMESNNVVHTKKEIAKELEKNKTPQTNDFLIPTHLNQTNVPLSTNTVLDSPALKCAQADKYRKGLGVPKDEKKAFQLYTEAANEGYAEGESSLGACYENGIGTGQNKEKAFELYQKAANQGNPIAQSNLAYCYIDGTGTSRDLNKGIYYLQKAADQGDAESENALANYYTTGIGVQANADKAFDLYKKAAEQGIAAAQNSVGLCYENGSGIKRDTNEAMKWYQKAADQGLEAAKLRISKIKAQSGDLDNNPMPMPWQQYVSEKMHHSNTAAQSQPANTATERQRENNSQITKFKGLYIGMTFNQAADIIRNISTRTIRKYNDENKTIDGDISIQSNQEGDVIFIQFNASVFNASDMSVEDFIHTFMKSYGIPKMEFQDKTIDTSYFSPSAQQFLLAAGLNHEWYYSSPNGFTITIDGAKNVIIVKSPKANDRSFN